MTHQTQNKTKIVPIRVTVEEHTAWTNEAAGTPLSAFVRKCVRHCLANRTYRPSLKLSEQDRKSLAQLFATLGQSRIASNLNQIAKAIHNGTIVVTPETELQIRRACEAVLTIRDILTRLLPKVGRR